MIRNTKLNDLNEIAKIHMESFENHFLPKLGLKLLSNYYKEFIDDSNIFVVSVNKNNEIDGFLLGTSTLEIHRNQFIKNNKIELSLRVLWLCFKFDKDTLIRVCRFINSFFSKKNTEITNNINKSSPKVISLLSICVSQQSKGKGNSIALIQEFEERLNKLGYEAYTLTVHKTNDRAKHFYKKIGMNIYKESDAEYGYIKQLIDNKK